LVSAAASADQAPADLVQYVRDARKLGLKDAQIQQNLVKAGWPAATVNQVIASGDAGRASQPRADRTETDGNPQQPSPNGTAALSAAAAPSNPAPGDGATPATIPPRTSQPPATEEASTAPKDRGVPEGYQIGEGDILQISVWEEPKASVPTAVVRPDGKITMPMIHEISVVGLTPAQAEQVISERLSKFINAVDVTVVVAGIHSKRIYLTGRVKKEGPIAYTYRMTIMQALSEAGGLTDYAKRKKIYVLRSQDGKEYMLPFNYDAVLKGEHMELNIPLMPGDTIVVP